MKTIETQHNEKIITPGFCCIAIANFLMFLSFYALMPVLPYYLREMAHDDYLYHPARR
ncbi:MAG: hypothetical protein HUK11_06125 [Muribaculaceae bacterium]|nr:hypothetical protein [Muribaculaceae bacterium]